MREKKQKLTCEKENKTYIFELKAKTKKKKSNMARENLIAYCKKK